MLSPEQVAQSRADIRNRLQGTGANAQARRAGSTQQKLEGLNYQGSFIPAAPAFPPNQDWSGFHLSRPREQPRLVHAFLRKKKYPATEEQGVVAISCYDLICEEIKQLPCSTQCMGRLGMPCIWKRLRLVSSRVRVHWDRREMAQGGLKAISKSSFTNA